MRHPLPCLIASLITFASHPAAAAVPATAPAPAPSSVSMRAESLIERLLDRAQPFPHAPVIQTPRWIVQKPGQRWNPKIPPVWQIRFTLKDRGSGYLFLSGDEEMRLEEFAFDFPQPVPPLNGGWIREIPNLQQFPVPSPSGKGRTASGCVPTAAASLIGFWTMRAFPEWIPTQGSSGEATPPAMVGTALKDSDLRAVALRLRSKMPMLEISDEEGYTDGTLSLSGAFPSDLAAALRKDATEQKVSVEVSEPLFSIQRLRAEIGAGRPVLVSCTVRLPHKPDLAWGHEMVAAGFQQVEDFDYVGVVDNFMPLNHASTLRWIEKSAFQSAICVKPEEIRQKKQIPQPSPE